MKESMITVTLAVCSGILLVLSIVGVCLHDRTAPVISLEGKNTMVYTEGEDYEVLLEDIIAEDNIDGDVSDSLRVSNIYVVSKDKAVVVYVAKDLSNNIAKLKREVRYVAAKTEFLEKVLEAQD